MVVQGAPPAIDPVGRLEYYRKRINRKVRAQTFFRHAETSEKHRAAAGNYAAASRSADLLRLRLATEDPDRIGGIQLLEGLMREVDKLERERQVRQTTRANVEGLRFEILTASD